MVGVVLVLVAGGDVGANVGSPGFFARGTPEAGWVQP